MKIITTIGLVEVDNYNQLIKRIFSCQSGEAEQVPPAKPELEMVSRGRKTKRSNTIDDDTSNNQLRKLRLTSGGSPEQ